MKFSFLKHTITIFLFLSVCYCAQGQQFILADTVFEGYIEGDQTWSSSMGKIVVRNDVLVPVGSTLTIEAGTMVGFKYGKKLIVEGRLIIDGTIESPVVFTAGQSKMIPTELRWEGIEIKGSSSEVDITGLVGQMAANLIHLNTNTFKSVEISHSYFYQNETAFLFSEVGANISIHHNYISDNEYGWVFHKPVPEKRIIHNHLSNHSEFDLINLSGKSFNLANNCIAKSVEDKNDGRGNSSQLILGNEIELEPRSKNCHPIPEFMNLSGGDITVVLDDDVIGTSVEFRKGIDYSIYPNPARESVKLEYQNFTPSSLLIFNSLGQVVEQINQVPLREMTIHVSHLPAGIYFIHLNTKQGLIRSRLVVMENW